VDLLVRRRNRNPHLDGIAIFFAIKQPHARHLLSNRLESLLEGGYDISIGDGFALRTAIGYGNYDAFGFFLKHGKFSPIAINTAFKMAMDSGKYDMARVLVSFGADVRHLDANRAVAL
jgi:hypothetical protein